MLDAICHNRGPCSAPSAIACRLRQPDCQRGHRLLGLCSREREVDQITSRIQRYQHDRAIDGYSRSNNNVVDDKGLGVCPSRPPQNYTSPTEQLSCQSFDAGLLGEGGIISEIEPRQHCVTIRSSARGSMAGPSEPLSYATSRVRRSEQFSGTVPHEKRTWLCFDRSRNTFWSAATKGAFRCDAFFPSAAAMEADAACSSGARAQTGVAPLRPAT